jgi:hypothetical protein
VKATVIGALRAFLPGFLAEDPPLSPERKRAIWAITHCRTPDMGGQLYACAQGCGQRRFVYHSCNHRACPQCGKAATAQWVKRELDKRINAPYFMVTFTLPQQLRDMFFGTHAKEAFDLFFAASSRALAQMLARPRFLGASTCGFTGVLHTWTQKLQFHPHIHYIVPGAGLDREGNYTEVKSANFLIALPALCRAFRRHFRQLLEERDWQVDPIVWTMDWGVRIHPFGNGQNAIKYLGTYVNRSAIADSRILCVDERYVTFRWKDRDHGGVIRKHSLPGREFVQRYLRHVLPCGLRSIRHFGFCHPTAKRTRQRIAFLSGRILLIGPQKPAATTRQALGVPLCPCCHQPMIPVQFLPPAWSRAPPTLP